MLLVVAFVTGFTAHVQAQVYEQLFNFAEVRAADLVNKGASPYGSLELGGDGNFYGTTVQGGNEANTGTAFKVTPAGVLTTLAEFKAYGGPEVGSSHYGSLTRGGDGNFYGTAGDGGAFVFGTVFRLTPAGVRTTLVDFTYNGASNRGAQPYGKLLQGGDGNFYGTTGLGGASGMGTIFKMTPGGVPENLIEFTGNGAVNKGRLPIGHLVQGRDSNLYGTTYQGGASNVGTIYKMTPAGALTTLAEFNGSATYPRAPLVQGGGADDSFYGTSNFGGTYNLGTVFKVTPAGALTILVNFNTNDESHPVGLVLGDDGNFYGTTNGVDAPGAYATTPSGTVFKVTPSGTLTKLVDLNGANAPKGT